MSDRPNFLFFITDQQRADWLGCYGHPVLKTPNIDAIAAEGVRFENFYAASPVCMPNRASLITGRYPSLHGLRYNGCVLPTSARTFLDVLSDDGYHTAAIGKSHLQPFTGELPTGKTRSEIENTIEAWKSDGAEHVNEEPDAYLADGRYDIDLPYYGYQYVDMVTQHGDKCGGHYHQWFREQTDDWQSLHDPASQLPHNYSCPQAYRTPIPEELYSTAYIRNGAIDYLKSRQGDDRPFFVFVSFPDPHHPFNPPGKYWDLYSPDEFKVRLPLSKHKNPTPPLLWLKEQWQAGGSALTPQTVRMYDEQQLREAMALSAGMMAFIDDAIGDVMASLEATGLKENTVVCFNSDHGDYLGDYNMLLKGPLPFKGITRVPFIWSDPKRRTASVATGLTSTVDLAPTLLTRAGSEPFYGIQGKNFIDILEGGIPHREDLLIEHNDGAPKLGLPEPARVRAVVTDRWRYTMYLDQDWGELYDLIDDPQECHNLWDSEKHKDIRAKLADRLTHHLTRQMDESPVANRLA